jgi:hypothetical protein
MARRNSPSAAFAPAAVAAIAFVFAAPTLAVPQAVPQASQGRESPAAAALAKEEDRRTRPALVEGPKLDTVTFSVPRSRSGSAEWPLRG